MKKFLSVVLSLIMLLSAVPLTAGATSVSRSSAVDWANSKVGQSIDWDGCYGAQCVDLVAAYYNYLGTQTPGGNGCDYAWNKLPSGWKRVQNANGVVPEAGDIAVWSKGYNGNKWGHVAIVVGADSSNMTVVEQYGSTDHKTHKNTIRYNRGQGYVLYGFIKPNFAGGTTNNGSMTTPTITLNKTNFNYGDTVNISWSKTASGTDFYQYWVVINNTTTGKQIFAGASGNAGDINANTYSFKISSYGAYSVTVYAVPYNDKNSRQKSATRTFTTGGYTVSFNANGGSGAPSAVTADTNGKVAIPNSKPTYNDKHTVTFNANSGTLSTVKTEYNKVFDYWYDNAGNKYYINGGTYPVYANTTLYAHYSYEYLSAQEPKKDNAYFVGWYDTQNIEATEPLGVLYDSNSQIFKDVTLYAMWSDTREFIFGDVYIDGKISSLDYIRIKKYVEESDLSLTASEKVFADVSADGLITTDDSDLIRKVIMGTITVQDFPAVKNFSSITIKTYPKLEYKYGEDFDYNGIVLQTNYNNSSVHNYLSEDYVVSGYDPYKIGTQNLTIHFYQWSVPLTVTVEAPEKELTLDANGGYVDNRIKTIQYSKNYGTLSTPVRDGYTFDGWFTSANGGSQITASSTVNTQNDVTLYAHWTVNTYDVSFYSNGGSAAPSSITNVAYGTSVELPANVLTKRHAKFVGWSEEQGSEFADFEAGDSMLVENDTKLYAVYEIAHTWNSGNITKQPTPTATGIRTYTCTICGETKTETVPKCEKYANTMVAKGKTKTVKYATLKKKSVTIARKDAISVTNAKGKVTYKKSSGNSKITVSSAGKITVKKGLKKGTYKVKVKVKAAGNATYKSKTVTRTVTIKVK